MASGTKRQEAVLEEINNEWIHCGRFDFIKDLGERLESYKLRFLEQDRDRSGAINLMELKQMMERMGLPKTHLELKKMMGEIDCSAVGLITYGDFLKIMLGRADSVLRMILIFEEREQKTNF